MYGCASVGRTQPHELHLRVRLRRPRNSSHLDYGSPDNFLHSSRLHSPNAWCKKKETSEENHFASHRIAHLSLQNWMRIVHEIRFTLHGCRERSWRLFTHPVRILLSWRSRHLPLKSSRSRISPTTCDSSTCVCKSQRPSFSKPASSSRR